MNKQININKFFNLYVSFCFFISVIFLYHKFLYPTDWTTSELLINYHGGFTRRGFVGEILLQINYFLNFKIRYLVFFFEILLLLLFYILIKNFFKNLKFSLLLVIIIFSPLGLLFPIIETESMGRKEFLFYCYYIIYLNSLSQNRNMLTNILVILGLPLINLTWDGSIFYYFFLMYSYMVQKNSFNQKNFLKFLNLSIPYFISIILLLFTKSNDEMLNLMCNAINEPCFGAMNFLNYSFYDQMNYGISRLKIEYIVRYILIFVFCFFPLISVFFNPHKNNKYLFGYIICVIPSFIFLIISFDWGRYLSILYIFLLLTINFLIKEKKIDIKNSFLSKKIEDWIKNKKNSILYMYIFVYLFCWHPKSTLTDDIGSFPYIRVLNRLYDYLLV